MASTARAGDLLCGDGNGDGSITAVDALFALRTAVGTASCALTLCDYNGDDKITATDALAILRKAVGGDIPPQCPVEQVGEVECQQLDAPQSGTCTVTPGSADTVLIGDVLTPGTIYRGGQVVVSAAGIIVQAGCAAGCSSNQDCAAMASGAATVTCAEAVISPGLINSHEHLTFSQSSPYVGTAERYEHRHQWRTGEGDHTQIPVTSAGNADAMAWTELRHLLGGTTSIIGSGARAGLLRNLDRAANMEGLDQPPVDFDTFPLADSDGDSATAPSCTYGENMVTPQDIASVDAYHPHVAEGLDARAANEAVCLGEANPAHDVTLDQTSFVHGIAISAGGLATMAERGTGLIWLPRSNLALYGNTATVTAAHRLGVGIALGTEWMATGSAHLLRELRCADSFNQTYLDGYFSDEDLWRMVTANAAVAAAMDDAIGTLAAGQVADITIFRKGDALGYDAVVDAEPEDVVLLMRGGKVIYGDQGVVSALLDATNCDTFDVCTTAKTLCLSAEIGKNLAALQSAVPNAYPPSLCGIPPNEPTCTPMRAASVDGSTVYTGTPSQSDADGDGIADDADNCPDVFNPVRPMDDGAQADDDDDDAGDACDPCPVDADTTDCPALAPVNAD